MKLIRCEYCGTEYTSDLARCPLCKKTAAEAVQQNTRQTTAKGGARLAPKGTNQKKDRIPQSVWAVLSAVFAFLILVGLVFFLLSILLMLVVLFCMLALIGCGFVADLCLILALIPIVGPLLIPFAALLVLVAPIVGVALVGGLIFLIVALARKSKKKKANAAAE